MKSLASLALMGMAVFSGCDNVPAPPTDPSVSPAAQPTSTRKGAVKSIKNLGTANPGSTPSARPTPDGKPEPAADPKAEPAPSK